MTIKICTKCGEFKSHEEFHLSSRTSDRREAVCKVCRSLIAKERYAAKQNDKGEWVVHYSDDWRADSRRCTACHQWKEWEEFPPASSGRNGHSSVCYPCTRERVRAKRRESPGYGR